MNRLQHILRRRTLLFWLALLLCCAALTAARWSVERQKRRAEANERGFRRRLDAVYYAVLPFRDRSIEQVAAGLNGGRPLDGQAGKEGRPTTALSGTVFEDRPPVPAGVDPLSLAPSFRAELPAPAIGPAFGGFRGWVIHLHFVNGALRGAYVVTPPHLVYAGPPMGWTVMQVALDGLFYIGVGVCCLSFLLVPFSRLKWRWFVRWAVAGLVLAGVARLLGRGLTLPVSLADVLHAPLLIAIAGAPVWSALWMLIPTRAKRARDKRDPPCVHCGYDLTGNVSGICPECGKHTSKGLIERWRDEAEQLSHVGEENPENPADEIMQDADDRAVVTDVSAV